MAPLDTSQYLNKWVEIPVAYNQRDLLLYAVSIGCRDLRYIYEHHEDFAAFPTYPLVLAFKGIEQDVCSFPSEAMQKMNRIPLEGVKVGLDGERCIEKIGSLNPEGGELSLKYRIIGAHKRGSGCSVETEMLISQEGKPVFRIISGEFHVGATNYTDSGKTNSKKISPPTRAPDHVVEVPTSVSQAELYRLSGDYNPLHVDSMFAKMSGFKEPILHGLCSYGMTANAALQTVADGDETRFKEFRARFAKPVIPGETLVVEMWKASPTEYIVQTRAKSTGDVVINNSSLTLLPAAKL